MSFVDFDGIKSPSKVEVAGTERNHHISLIVLLFQKSVYQLVSDFDQRTAIAHYILTIYLYLYTELPFQSFHCAFRYICQFSDLSDWITCFQ